MTDVESPVKQCQLCGYDMTDRDGGETCPECGSALDTRPDDQRYLQAGFIAKVLLVWAIALQILLPPVAILLAFAAAFQLAKRHDASQYRLSYRARRDRKHANYLAFIWFFIFVAMVVISEMWPNWQFWLD